MSKPAKPTTTGKTQAADQKPKGGDPQSADAGRKAHAEPAVPKAAKVKGPDAALLLRRLVQALEELIANSQGVYGLHANGDMAPWPTLSRGGEYPGWLDDLDRARDFVRVQS